MVIWMDEIHQCQWQSAVSTLTFNCGFSQKEQRSLVNLVFSIHILIQVATQHELCTHNGVIHFSILHCFIITSPSRLHIISLYSVCLLANWFHEFTTLNTVNCGLKRLHEIYKLVCLL